MEYFYLSNYIEELSYLGVFFVMALTGNLIPAPEEIILLLIGYTATIGFSNVYFLIIVAIAGVIVGDNALFFLSRSSNVYMDKLKRKINPDKMKNYEQTMRQHAGKTIFLSRFIVGLRFFSPVLAGSLKIKWKTFLFYNILSSLIYVPVFICLGYYFSSDILSLITEAALARHIIFILLITVIGLLISFWVGKRFLKRANDGQ